MLVASALSEITEAITSVIGDYGLYAVFALMLIDAVFPAASEVVMVYGGALASGAFAGQEVTLFGNTIEEGWPAYLAIALAGSIGYTIGAVIGWAIGLYGGKPFLERRGRWFHLDEKRLDRAERWFDRWGDWGVFLGRLDAGRPLVRLDPRRRLRGAARPLHGADVPRLLDLVLRLRRRRVRGGRELGGLPSRLPLRRVPRGRRRSSRSSPGWSGASCASGGARPRSPAAPDEVWVAEANPPLATLAGGTQSVNQIPLIDVKAQYEPLIPELQERFAAVLESGRFIFGPEVEAFEREAAAFLGVPHAIGVANGTDALVLALEALEIGAGDEVICPSFTFYATAESIARVGATPVFADIDPETLNLDPEDVAARITPRTSALMPVHLFGRPAPLAELAELRLPMIEDAAQAFGADGVAQTGVCSTFSFFPTKNLFALGDGGLVTSLDDAVADRVRLLRFHGSRDKVTFELIGTNSRLDAIQAAALRVFLPHLTGWNAARREAAARYAELGLGELVELPRDDAGHVYHMYVARSSRRDEIRDALTAAGIASASYYVTPLHLQPALRHLGWERGSLPETERAAAENLALPMWGTIGAEPAGARRRDRALGARRPGVGRMRSPSTGTGSGRSRSTAASSSPRGCSPGTCASRAPGAPSYYDRYLEWDVIALVLGIKLPLFFAFGFYNRWWRYVSTQDMWVAVRGVAAAAVAVFLVFTLLDFHPASVPRGIWIVDTLLLLAFVTGSRLLARTLIERPSAGTIVARGREVHHRRRRRRRAADPPRDAEEPRARATRRSGSSTTTRARRTCACTGSACSVRPTSSATCCATAVRTRS